MRPRPLDLMLILSAAAVVCVATDARALTPISSSQEAVIAREAQAWMRKHKAPSVSIAIVLDGQVRWQRAFGYADVARRVPATPRTVYRLASITKSLTATAVMQLVDRGRIQLDAPVQRYCPAFPVKAWPVTVRQLLSHTAGVRHYTTWEQLFPNRTHYPSLQAALPIFSGDPLVSKPGDRYLYTTYGYAVLGCAIEGASGQPYAAYLRDHILRPVGMMQTRPEGGAARSPDRAALYSKGWLYRTLGWWPTLAPAQALDNSDRLAGGGMLSTAPDMARFGAAMMNGQIVSARSRQLMWTRARTNDGKPLRFYGLGWLVGDPSGGRPKRVWNDGDQAGTRTYLYLVPERRFAVALMTNMDEAPVEELVPAITTLFGIEPARS